MTCEHCVIHAESVAWALGLTPGTLGAELVSVGCEAHEPRTIAAIMAERAAERAAEVTP